VRSSETGVAKWAITVWKQLKPHERTWFAESIGHCIKPRNLKTMIKNQADEIEQLKEQLAKTQV
jgi:hypothetical protein